MSCDEDPEPHFGRPPHHGKKRRKLSEHGFKTGIKKNLIKFRHYYFKIKLVKSH